MFKYFFKKLLLKSDFLFSCLNCVFIKCPKGHIFKRSPYKMGFNNDTGKYMRCTHKECEDRNYKNKFAHRGKNRKKEQ